MGGDDDQTSGRVEEIPSLDANLQKGLFPVLHGHGDQGNSNVGRSRVEEISQGAEETGYLRDDEPMPYDGRARYRFNYKTGGWQRRT